MPSGHRWRNGQPRSTGVGFGDLECFDVLFFLNYTKTVVRCPEGDGAGPTFGGRNLRNGEHCSCKVTPSPLPLDLHDKMGVSM